MKHFHRIGYREVLIEIELPERRKIMMPIGKLHKLALRCRDFAKGIGRLVSIHIDADQKVRVGILTSCGNFPQIPMPSGELFLRGLIA